MQAIAHAVGFNETAFALPSARADLRLRYFTPGHEVDLCGHATVGTFVLLHARGRLPGAGLPRHLTLETGAGLLPVTVDVDPGGEPIVVMAQAPARFAPWEGRRTAPRRHYWSSRARRSAATGARGCGWSGATGRGLFAWAVPAASCAR
jgi:PhzF family phenazine biosynthesis protein